MSRYYTDYPRYAWQVLRGYRARLEQQYAATRETDIAPYLDTHQPLRVLDLANGRLRPQYALLRAAGHRVVGIDMVNRPRKTPTDRAYQVARLLYCRKLGLAIDATATDMLTGGDVTRLPFANEQFDLVTSIAAFEHFLDVPAVLAELARVLRPGGIVWARIHLFTALSGGHNTSLIEIPLRHLPAGAVPWDHLRQRKLPFHVPLNEWRKDQYVAAFAQHFDVVQHYCHTREGEDWLTPQIETELARYSRDDLTCRSYIIVARKPAG
jgi:SAM-dependent methyltransferase